MSIEVALFGTLGRDGEPRTSKNLKPYLRLNVRVGDGEGAQWVSVMAFDPTAIEGAEKFTQGARIYCEGSLKLSEWTAADGTTRHGLSVMSWHTRLAAIGRNKPKRPTVSVAGGSASAAAGRDFHSDPLPFAPEWR